MSNDLTMSNTGSAAYANEVRGNVITTTTIYNYGEAPPRNNTRPFIIFGMYEGWSYCTNGNPFQIQDINVDKFTHVTYACIQPNMDGSINFMDNQNLEGQRFKPFLRLKHQKPNIKLFLSLGGWMEDKTIFPNVINNENIFRVFLNNLGALFKRFQFDGLNLVWLYPKSIEKSLYVKFFSELRKDVLLKDRILTMVISNDFSARDAFDFSELNGLVDYYNVMSYGFSRYEPKTELNAPIASIVSLIDNLEDAGIEHNKIVLGLNFKGIKFNLKDPAQNGLNCDCMVAGESVAAFEIQELMRNGIWETISSENGDSIYSFSSNVWIGHENESSVSAKVKYAFRNRYAGVMIDAINSEMASDSTLLNAVTNTLAEINK